MTRKMLLLSLLSTYTFAADSLESWFSEGEVKGNVKYYFIETDKDKADGTGSSAHANSIGGQLSYTTADLYGFSAGATFMTTNGFLLPDNVDTSILGRDNGVRLGTGAGGQDAQDSFSVLGEAFIAYNYKDLSLLYGRKVIDTPLVNAKVVRMLPSSVQGGFINYKLDTINFGAAYLTHFKQRTSSQFTNMVEHALGDKTQAITGNSSGDVAVIDVTYKTDNISVKLYDDYAKDFLNSMYLEASFKNELSSGWSYGLAGQFISQMSVGNADTNLQNDLTLAGGQISSNAFGLKADLGYKESSLYMAATNVRTDDSKHDSLVLPWDGTPLFTNMITSNDLFQSNYGQALNADSAYISGSTGVKLAYTQKYNFTGIDGFKTVLSYLNVNNSKFTDNQEDFNAVLAYGIGNLSVALKGIWVHNNSSSDALGNVSQLDKLTQYRVIANYKF